MRKKTNKQEKKFFFFLSPTSSSSLSFRTNNSDKTNGKFCFESRDGREEEEEEEKRREEVKKKVKFIKKSDFPLKIEKKKIFSFSLSPLPPPKKVYFEKRILKNGE